MAYISSSDRAFPGPSPLAALSAGFAGFRAAIRTYRHQRSIYLRTLRELEAYRPHELHDLKVQPADFEELARKQAGW